MSKETYNPSNETGSKRSAGVEPEHSRMQDVRDKVWESGQVVSQCVEDHPMKAVASSFISGLIVGTCIGLVLGSSRQRSPWYSRDAAERIGNSLLSRMSHVIPDSLKH